MKEKIEDAIVNAMMYDTIIMALAGFITMFTRGVWLDYIIIITFIVDIVLFILEVII